MNEFDEDYFMRGPETKKSLYSSYQWMPSLTVPMVVRLITHLGITQDHTILDYGCARGYIVRSFRELGYKAYGFDVSEWAIKNADEVAKPYVANEMYGNNIDWIIAKDVLEHIDLVQQYIDWMMAESRVGIFVVVPLAPEDGREYVVEDYELDVTHIHRLTLATWARMFMRPGWSVEASYAVRGVKENYSSFKTGNGFLTCRRLPG